MRKKVAKHTLETANLILKEKKLDHFLQVIDFASDNLVIIRDREFGPYKANLKGLCPKTPIATHPARRTAIRLEKARLKYIGKTVRGYLVKDLFYGPERGYKNKSYYLIVIGDCGHDIVTTATHLFRYRTNVECRTCTQTEHGSSGKDRSGTYTYWQRSKKKWPHEFQDFGDFRKLFGEKPTKYSQLVNIGDGKWAWQEIKLSVDDQDVNSIGIAIRQAFRSSRIFKKALVDARIETDKTSLYRCAICKNEFKRKEVQVDHIDPIQPLDGTPLTKEELIEAIWTDKIQVIDKKCHYKKTAEENRVRRNNKKLIKG